VPKIRCRGELAIESASNAREIGHVKTALQLAALQEYHSCRNAAIIINLEGRAVKIFRNATDKRRPLRSLPIVLAMSLATNGVVPAALADTNRRATSANGVDQYSVAMTMRNQTFDVADDSPPSPTQSQNPLTAQPPNAPSGLSDKAAQENMFWESAQRSNSIADYKAYLDAYPNGLYAPLAKNRITAMTAAPQPATFAPATGAPSAFGPPPPTVSPEALKSEIGTVETEQSLNMGQPARMELQQRLSALGLYNGPIDGDLGPGMRSAIAEWQKRHNLASTGEIGPIQLAALRAESEAPYQQLLAAPRPAVMVAPRPVYSYPVRRVVHVYQGAPSYAAPAALGILSGLAIGILGAKLGGGGKGGGKGHGKPPR
jgi:hypothetical protein